MSEKRVQYPSQKGNLVISHGEDIEGRCVYIYGDPQGLRSLGELLIAEAELDQTRFPEINLPAGVPHHIHLYAGKHIHPQSLSLVIGRLDAKGTGEYPEWLRRVCMKSERGLMERVCGDEAVKSPESQASV
jgi:hypothetical protein